MQPCSPRQPGCGRFLQTDPEPGGSANNYDYCSQDPINCYDLQGTWWGSGVLKKAVHAVESAWQHSASWWKKNYKQAIMYTVGTVLIVGAIALTGGAAAAVLAASDGILEAAAAEAAEAATEQAAQLAMANAKFEILQVAVHALASAGASAGTMYWAGGYLLATGHQE